MVISIYLYIYIHPCSAESFLVTSPIPSSNSPDNPDNPDNSIHTARSLNRSLSRLSDLTRHNNPNNTNNPSNPDSPGNGYLHDLRADVEGSESFVADAEFINNLDNLDDLDSLDNPDNPDNPEEEEVLQVGLNDDISDLDNPSKPSNPGNPYAQETFDAFSPERHYSNNPNNPNNPETRETTRLSVDILHTERSERISFLKTTDFGHVPSLPIPSNIPSDDDDDAEHDNQPAADNGEEDLTTEGGGNGSNIEQNLTNSSHVKAVSFLIDHEHDDDEEGSENMGFHPRVTSLLNTSINLSGVMSMHGGLQNQSVSKNLSLIITYSPTSILCSLMIKNSL